MFSLKLSSAAVGSGSPAEIPGILPISWQDLALHQHHSHHSHQHGRHFSTEVFTLVLQAALHHPLDMKCWHSMAFHGILWEKIVGFHDIPWMVGLWDCASLIETSRQTLFISIYLVYTCILPILSSQISEQTISHAMLASFKWLMQTHGQQLAESNTNHHWSLDLWSRVEGPAKMKYFAQIGP